jgi:hypothetical protein
MQEVPSMKLQMEEVLFSGRTELRMVFWCVLEDIVRYLGKAGPWSLDIRIGF